MHWEGHKAATATALFDVIENASTGNGRISDSDRVLFTACEFWASINNGTLLKQLTESPAQPQLVAAESAFEQIGLKTIVDTIRRGRLTLSEIHSPTAWQGAVNALEQSLSQTTEPVDQSIAEYANRSFSNKRMTLSS